MTTLTVAIIGRPNVGKSTLFNRLVGRRIALVHDAPGMTRDRKRAAASLYGLDFDVLDTAGLADPDDSELTARMQEQTLKAIHEADLLFFMIDGRDGCTLYDQELAQMLRCQHKPILVLVNKCEGRFGATGLAEAHQLGLGSVIGISAEHGEGMPDLYEELQEFLKTTKFQETDSEEEGNVKPLQLAVMGRPNVGKSTLINHLIGEERLLTADMPGVTRDAIRVSWVYQDQAINLIDTAGIRRRSRIDTKEEKLAVMDTERTLKYAEVVILLIDGNFPIEKQDLTLASQIIKEGRCLVLALNKWDSVIDKAKTLSEVQYVLEQQLAQVKGIPCIPISAKNGKNVLKLLDAALEMYGIWNQRVSTGLLNRWLEHMVLRHPAPAIAGRRIRLKYMTQIKTRPPTFAVFASKAAELPESYVRYLINGLREDFKLPGVPIRIHVRASENPYEDK